MIRLLVLSLLCLGALAVLHVRTRDMQTRANLAHMQLRNARSLLAEYAAMQSGGPVLSDPRTQSAVVHSAMRDAGVPGTALLSANPEGENSMRLVLEGIDLPATGRLLQRLDAYFITASIDLMPAPGPESHLLRVTLVVQPRRNTTPHDSAGNTTATP